MQARTATVALPASRERVFEYLADPLNHPEWATEFIRRIEEVDGELWAETMAGRVRYAVEPDPVTGVVDIVLSADPAPPARFPTRVVAVSPEASVFTFTLTQAPGMPDEEFEGGFASLERELATLQARFERG